MNNIYSQIAQRTSGHIYIGVVGPVRTGKSTFITRFMEKMVLPNVVDEMVLNRTKDELPQSGSGNMIMTMQPRFVPNEAVEISLSGDTHAKIRLVDSVGYLIDGVSGHEDENGLPRMVNTPWSESPIPFSKAAEVGTSKVIKEHSTIGVIVTTDGTISGLEREAYMQAEERVVSELKALDKPFIILLNSLSPEADSTKRLKTAMEEKYKAKVIACNVAGLEEKDFENIMEKVLYEFPVEKLEIKLPEWMRGLPFDNEIITRIVDTIRNEDVKRIEDKIKLASLFDGDADLENPTIEEVDLSKGVISAFIGAKQGLYFKTLSGIIGNEIGSDKDLMAFIRSASYAKKEYDKLQSALESAKETGYGVVVPVLEDMELSSPEVISKAGSSALKLKAKAASYHIMKVDVEAEVSPAVGGAQVLNKSDENGEVSDGIDEIWKTTMFGKSLSEIAHDGIITKLNTFPKEAETKLRKTITKITNEGKGGIICILL